MQRNSRDDDEDSENDSSLSGSYENTNYRRRLKKFQDTRIEHECVLQSSSQYCEGSRKNLCGLGILFSLPSEEKQSNLFQQFFFNHITIFENHVWKIIKSIENITPQEMPNAQKLIHDAFLNFRKGFEDLIGASRIEKPLWLSMASKNDLQSYENFMESLSFLTKTCDTKHNGL